MLTEVDYGVFTGTITVEAGPLGGSQAGSLTFTVRK